eukprot:2822917-Pleurochrysis_carterae.AAC.4
MRARTRTHARARAFTRSRIPAHARSRTPAHTRSSAGGVVASFNLSGSLTANSERQRIDSTLRRSAHTNEAHARATWPSFRSTWQRQPLLPRFAASPFLFYA